MKESRIAVRYAKALFELALEQKNTDAVFYDMKLVADTCHSNKDFRLMLISPIINSDKKRNILKLIFENNINKLSQAFLNIITAKRRESYIEQIANQYISLYRDNKGIETVYLTTAVKADDEIKTKVKSVVNKFTKKEVELIEDIKTEIIGGFVLNFGHYQYDDSIRNKIIKLKREYNINIYEKGF
ncbi:MAG TPA: ATP synthase F1 subunit delta [Bacteroidales bacterium]|nr:ATP synthase F1 subunit delta [Bacteroidales bacterium]HPS16670.1 ATP synthase F1 subunit delta [Bacteroidales bacterium]